MEPESRPPTDGPEPAALGLGLLHPGAGVPSSPEPAMAPPLPMPVSIPEPASAGSASHPEGLVRQTVEFLITLCLSILLFRTFAAEAYVVPTGSMAPTLLGIHQELTCPNCKIRFALGMDDQGRAGGRPVCPNCGRADIDRTTAVACNGDRLLVQKFLFDLRPPRRWEVAVFHSPAEPSQAYVKRVVGLPGESVLISGGDIYADGHIARKTLAEQQAMRMLVYDNNFVPGDSERYPRFNFRRGQARSVYGRWGGGGPRPVSGWKPLGTHFLHEPSEADSPELIDWLEYRHWDPDRNDYGAIHDFCPYNGGGDYRGENTVPDLMVEANVSVGPDVRSVAVRLSGGGDRFLVTIPVDGVGSPNVMRNGRPVELTGAEANLLRSSPSDAPRFTKLEASLMDRRLTVALDGRLLFDPYDFDDPSGNPNASPSPVALGVIGGAMEVADLRIFRDVYYTSALANSPRRPFGVETPYQLGPGEFFVLGDNSPVSNDSRFWPSSPVVRAELFLGKPFLVHLPSQGFPLQVFGRELYWIPDPREIRYIR